MEITPKKIVITSLLVFVLLLGGLFTYLYTQEFTAVEDNPFSSSRINILVSGRDETQEEAVRADTIFVLSIDLDSGAVGVLFVPRDTRLEIPGYGVRKVNASYAVGGINLLQETLESYLEIPIDYYVDVDFEGFIQMVDILGGVEIEVEEDLYYRDEAGGLEIDISAGRQILDGEEALDYVRYRGPIRGDIGRISRQKEFLFSGLDRMMQPDMIPKIPAFFREFQENVSTDIPFLDITPFVKLLRELDKEEFKVEILPGEPRYIEDVSYWIAQEEQVDILVNSLIRSNEYVENSRYTVKVYNGNGVAGTAGSVADKLRKYGFNVAGVFNADHFNYGTTIISHSANSKYENAARGIQKLIGGEKHTADLEDEIRIIIGRDYVTHQVNGG